MGLGLVRQLFQVGAQVLGAEGAVQAHGDRLGVAHRVPEGFGGLPRQGAAGGVGDGAGNHDRQLEAQFLEHALHGEDRRLGVQGVEDGLDQDQVRAALDQAAGGLGVVLHQLVEGDVAVAGVVHVRGDGAGTAGRAEHAGDEARPVRRLQGLGIGHLAGQARAFDVQLVDQLFHAVVGLGHAGGVEGVGLEDVRAGVQVGLLDGLDHVRAAQQQQVVVALHVARPVGEAGAAVVLFLQLVALDHGAHAAVEDQDALFERLLQGLLAGDAVGHGNYLRAGVNKGGDDSKTLVIFSLSAISMNFVHVDGGAGSPPRAATP
ncbi:hypothetical protein D9M70_338560 [compost metagenome]